MDTGENKNNLKNNENKMKKNPKNLRLYKGFVKEQWVKKGKDQFPTCEHCVRPIGRWDMDEGCYVPRYHNVSHGKKGRRTAETCLDPLNIKFLCFACHAKEHKLKVSNADWLDR